MPRSGIAGSYGGGSGGGLVAKLCPVLAMLGTVAHQAPLPRGFSRQGYCSGLPFPSPGDLPDPGIEAGSPALQADSLPTELQGKLNDNKLCAQSLSYIQLFEILWTIARQASLSMGFSRQGYLSGLPCPLPGDLPDSGIKPVSPDLLHCRRILCVC